MYRFRWFLFLLLLIPRASSAIELRWSSGASELTFASATRCTLVVQADSVEGSLPSEWRLLWVTDSCQVIQPVSLDSVAACQQDVAEVSSVGGPRDFAFVAGGWTPTGSWVFHLFYIRQNQYATFANTTKDLGHAVSNDLDQWTVLDTAAIKVRSGKFDSQHVWAPSIVQKGLTYYMFYTGVDDNGNQRTGVATSTDLRGWIPGNNSIFEASSPGNDWVDATPAGYGGQAQFRDPFVMQDPNVPGDWLMYFATVAKDYSPGMVVGLARSHGDFTAWSNAHPLWATLYPYPRVGHVPRDSAAIVESPHTFQRHGKWWLLYTVNGDSVYSVANPNSPTDTTTGDWSQTGPLQTLVPSSEGTTYNNWHATEYLEIPSIHDIHYLAAYEDVKVDIAYTQMGPANAPLLFTGQCPSFAGVGEVARTVSNPRLILTGVRPVRSRLGLRVELPAGTRVELALYDVLGRRVMTLVNGDLPAGTTNFTWDGRDKNGTLVGSGVYFASLTAAG